MPKILTFNNENIKYPFFKRLKDWYDEQDKFIKATIIITALLIISTPVIVSMYLSFRQNAATAQRQMVMGISMPMGHASKDNKVNDAIAAIDSFKDKVGQYPGTFSIWVNFGPTGWEYGPRDSFPNETLLKALDERNITPVVFMQPVGPGINRNGGNIDAARKYSNASIASGSFDDFLNAFAQSAKAYGKPVILRYAHEMNGTWFPWSPYYPNGNGKNYFDVGNTSENYVAAWKHVYTLIHTRAPNVKLLWSPNRTDSADQIRRYFPGKEFVDYIGFDAYRWPGEGGSMRDKYQSSIVALRRLVMDGQNVPSTIPMIVGETGVYGKIITPSSSPAFAKEETQALFSAEKADELSQALETKTEEAQAVQETITQEPAQEVTPVGEQENLQATAVEEQQEANLQTATAGNYRDAWIRDGYIEMYNNFPDVKAIIYFDFDMTNLFGVRAENVNWLLSSEPEATSAYISLSSDPRFQGRFDLNPPTPTNTPTPAPKPKLPKGYHDTLSCTVSTGWACDPDNYSQAIDVHFYKDKPADNGGTFIGKVTASLPRESAVGGQCGGNSSHGFSFTIPEGLKDGQRHKVYAYGINIGPSGENPLLSQSPKIITCGTTGDPSPTAQTKNIFSLADTYIGEKFPTQNFGRSIYIRSDGDPESISYLRFDTGSLSNKTIDKAILILTVAGTDGAKSALAAGLDVKGVSNTTWNEYNMTYNKTHPKLGQTLITHKGRKATGETIELDVTQYIKQHRGLVSLGLFNNGSDGVTFNSRESSQGKPHLKITYH